MGTGVVATHISLVPTAYTHTRKQTNSLYIQAHTRDNRRAAGTNIDLQRERKADTHTHTHKRAKETQIKEQGTGTHMQRKRGESVQKEEWMQVQSVPTFWMVTKWSMICTPRKISKCLK